MPPKPERSSDASGRDATATDHTDAHATVSSSAFARAPSYSPAELAGFRDFAKVMRDAIGEKGSFTELKPKEAAERGCFGTLQSLHRRGRVTFHEDLCQHTAYGGQLKVLKWLGENGCPWDEATDDGVTPLFLAAQVGHEAVVRALIEAGVDVNKAKDIGATPLYATSQVGYETIVRALIEAGADVNKAMINNSTPLIVAAQNGQEAVVRTLLDAGAYVNQKAVGGETPLSVATTPISNVDQGDHAAVVQILRDAGAA